MFKKGRVRVKVSREELRSLAARLMWSGFLHTAMVELRRFLIERGLEVEEV